MFPHLFSNFVVVIARAVKTTLSLFVSTKQATYILVQKFPSNSGLPANTPANMEYIYQKERREFGRQCLFSDKNELLFSEAPSRDLAKEYINRNPVSQGTQLGRQMAASEVSSISKSFFKLPS
jgi:hypothetical protein